jgi:chemotaxis receptor (MCP) glutamine deamidase CheD
MAHPPREVTIAPDGFEVIADDAILIAELRSAVAICLYDAVEEAGALLHLRCIVHSAKPPAASKRVDMTDTTLASELLLLDRCVESLRKASPTARNLQARIVGHLADDPRARETLETLLYLVRQLLADANLRLLPADLAGGPARTLRFRPAMGWVQVR